MSTQNVAETTDIYAEVADIIAAGDPYRVLRCARDHPEAVTAMQQVILDSGSAYNCYRFALDVPGADAAPLQKIVVDSGEPVYCFDFACTVVGADIPTLQRAVMDSGDMRWCCEFGWRVPGADLDAVVSVLVDAGREDLVVELANRLREI